VVCVVIALTLRIRSHMKMSAHEAPDTRPAGDGKSVGGA
jgi:hypothetical protein